MSEGAIREAKQCFFLWRGAPNNNFKVPLDPLGLKREKLWSSNLFG